MAFDFKKLKKEISSLSEADFEKFAKWFDRLHEQRHYNKKISSNRGIPVQDVLKVFTKRMPKVGGKPHIHESDLAASVMQHFYLDKRIKGCNPDEDEDILMTEWQAESKSEFSLSHIREIAPPRHPDCDSEIWQLRLEMRFAMTPALNRLKPGSKVFRSFAAIDKHREFFAFAVTSPVGKATEKLAPSRIILTYENVE